MSIPNRKHSSSPISLNKYLPYVSDSKRLSLLVKECNNAQIDLKNIWKKITNKSTKNQQLFRAINKITEHQLYDEFFRLENEKRKKKIAKLQSKNQGISEVQKKIDSIIKSPKLNEKYNLERLNQIDKNLSKNEKLFIEFDEIKSKEAQELLKVNKRNFGEYFQQELALPSPKVLGYDTPLGSPSKSPKIQMKKKVLRIKNGRNLSGTVSSINFPYIKKKTLQKDEREMLENILKEKKNATERFLVQKYMSGKYKKL